MSAHYVYRIYDEDGRLIYVGCTLNLFARLSAHTLNSWWAYQCSHVVAKVYPSKAAGRAVERAVIRTEKPRWNLNGRPPHSQWTEAEYVDCATALANIDRLTEYRRTRLQNLARFYRLRFGCDLPVNWQDVA